MKKMLANELSKWGWFETNYQLAQLVQNQPRFELAWKDTFQPP